MSATVKRVLQLEVANLNWQIHLAKAQLEWAHDDRIERARAGIVLDRLISARYDLSAYLAVHFKESK